MEEIKSAIQKSRIRMFDRVLWIREERILMKMQHIKMEGKRPRRPRTRWTEKIRKDLEMKGENWGEIQENRKWDSRDS